MLLNAAKCQAYSFYRFWVIKREPIEEIKLQRLGLNTEKNVDQSLDMENDVELRTEAVENTNSLRENSEAEIFITDIGNMSNKANLSDAQKLLKRWCSSFVEKSFQTTSFVQISVKLHSPVQKATEIELLRKSLVDSLSLDGDVCMYWALFVSDV